MVILTFFLLGRPDEPLVLGIACCCFLCVYIGAACFPVPAACPDWGVVYVRRMALLSIMVP